MSPAISCVRTTLSAVLILFALTGAARSQNPPSSTAHSASRVSLADLPLSFEPNRGQAQQPTRFVVRGSNLNMALRPAEMDLLLVRADQQSAIVRLDFVGADTNAEISGSAELASYSNYLRGSDPSHWLAHVPNYGRVTYNSIYPGVNLVFYGNGRQLEHDFVVAPFADYRAIRLRVDGADHIQLQANGDLELKLKEGKLVLQSPVAYQTIAGAKRAVKSRFELRDEKEFGFVLDEYDHSLPLTIDPTLVYSTYLADLSTYMYGVAADAGGNTYVTGLDFSGTFPVTANAFQHNCVSCSLTNQKPDVFVTKINPTGTALVYSTYLGGSDYDQPFGIAVDGAGNAVIAGYTGSTDFPVKNPVGAGTASNGTTYGFVSSLSADGSALNYSSILGGGAQPDQSTMTTISSVALDSGGNAYVTGTTYSPVIPVTPGALNRVAPPYSEVVVFVTKFLTTGALGYSAIVGDPNPTGSGGGLIGGNSIGVDASGSAYITGSAGDLWPTTTGAYQTTSGSASQSNVPFLTKLSPDGSQLAYSTFVGHGGVAVSVAVKPTTGEAFISGSPAAADFSTTPNAYQQTTGSQCCPPFIAELSADGSTLEYASFFGADATQSYGFTNVSAIALDGANNIWLTGNTSDPQFTLKYPLQSVPALSSAPNPSTAFLSRLDPSGATLTFSSLLGGSDEGGNIVGIAFDADNKAHVAGTTGDALYTTAGAYLATVTPPPPNYFYNYGFAAVVDADALAPALCFNPPALFYGQQQVGVAGPQQLTITNCGNAPLQIASIQSSNPLFAVPAQANGCLQAVAVNASCAVSVVYTPNAVEFDSGSLTVASNAPITSTVLPLQGTGAVPVISASGIVQFDPTFVGQTSLAQSLLITNLGGAPLVVDPVHTTVSAGFAISDDNCNQPVFQNGYCFISVTFTPAAAGAVNGTLNIASNDPVTPTVVVSLTGTGYTSYPAPTLMSLYPSTVAAGGTSFMFEVTGTNFFPASVVRIGGVAQPTTYSNSSQLTVNGDPALIATIGELPVTVFNPTPGGGETSAITLTVYASIPLAANGLLDEPFSQQLFATVDASDANHPNAIAAINPANQQISRYIGVGNTPRHLAASDDGQYLYVSLDGDHAIQRINLSNFSVEKTFSLPIEMFGGMTTVRDMKVVPGIPTCVVASLNVQASPPEAGIALFCDSGLVNWLNDQLRDAVDAFAIAGNPPVAYTLPNAFSSFSISSSGIAELAIVNNNVANTGYDLESDGTLLYTTQGLVWNPATQTAVGTYNPAPGNTSASVIPDDSNGRTSFLTPLGPGNNGPSVEAYDQQTLGFLGSVDFLSTVIGSEPFDLQRWGDSGFAFIAGASPGPTGNQVLIFRSSIAHANAATNPAPVLNSLDTTVVTVGGSGFMLGVEGSGFVQGSVVEWNGAVRTTNFVSATQLSADISAADIAQAGTAQITVVNPTPGGGTSSALPFTIAAPPSVSVQPGSLTFASQVVGVTSAAQTVTFTNTGSSPVTISNIQASGDFAETNNCPASLSAQASCTISVSYTPTIVGAEMGTLIITDNGANGPQTVALSGTGAPPDFSFGGGGSNTTSATVTAGQTATYQLSVVASPGLSGTVALTCTQVPPHAACTITPSTLTLTPGATSSFTVSVKTSVSTAAALLRDFPTVTATCGLVFLLGLPFVMGGRKKFFLRAPLTAALLAGVGIVLVSVGLWGCGGGSKTSTPGSDVTPQGTYTIKIVATEGSLSHSQSITLVVQ
jgi:beta-propeller repeat-containing protein/centrosomal CEP192-like protein